MIFEYKHDLIVHAFVMRVLWCASAVLDWAELVSIPSCVK